MPKTASARTRPRDRLPTGRAAAAKAGGSSASDRLMGLQHRFGNQALGRLLRGGPPPIGRATDPAEGRADRHAARAERGERPSGPRLALGGLPRLGGGRRLSPSVQRAVRPHFRADPADVRVHSGSDVDLAARAMGAEGFSFGRDVFLRSDRRPQHPGGMNVLRHELAHIDAEGGRGRVIRRKAGLPTAAEATTTGGTSGLGMFAKGKWGKYRTLLDQFRALDDSDTEQQAEVLLKLTKVSRKIAAGDFEAKKKTYVQEQMPKIKRLYYEVALKPKVYDEVAQQAQDGSETQRARLDAAIAERMDKLKFAMKHAKWQEMDPDTRPKHHMGIPVEAVERPTADALTARLDSAPLTMNFAPSALRFFTADSDVKQFWELESDKKAAGERQGPEYADHRKTAEDLMGYTTSSAGLIADSERAHRPISCGLNVFDNPRGAAPGYGKWHFKLKDEVKTRATYLSRDSVNHVKRQIADKPEKRVEHIGVQGHLDGVLASNVDMLSALMMESTGQQDFGKIRDHEGGRDLKHDDVHQRLREKNYLEVQVHGGLNIDDIDWLVVDTPEEAADRTTAEQQSEGALVDAWKAKYAGKARVRWNVAG